MIITQLSIPIPNRPGELSRLSDILGDEGINIRALTAAVNREDAFIHLVADDPGKAEEVLKSKGYEPVRHDVIAVETPDHPGGLNAILRPLKQDKINVEFLYPAIGKIRGNAVLIVGADPIAQAVAALERHYLTILGKEFYVL
jgi:hypothetical protein